MTFPVTSPLTLKSYISTALEISIGQVKVEDATKIKMRVVWHPNELVFCTCDCEHPDSYEERVGSQRRLVFA